MMKKILILHFIFISSVYTQTLAKYEPVNGCYLGVFTQNDVNVSGSIYNFEKLVVKEHAGYLTYTSVSSPFPGAFVDSCKKYGSFMQLGFEPDTAFRDVFDGPHLRNWAKEAARSGVPIFLRFASEMNGNWVPWFGSPTLYKEKWRLMYQIMKEEAPNVVMVWCPSWRPDIPNDTSRNIMAYYPGDEYVDWIGVNFYMWGPVYDSLMGETGISALQKISAVYNKFPNKPIMICEWAAASREWRGTPPLPRNTVDYCINHMTQVYSLLSHYFPRVKGIFWFNYNSYLINKSDFSLTTNPVVLNNYKNLIQSNYYISEINYNVPKIEVPKRIVRGLDTVFFSILCSRPLVEIKLYINEQLIQNQSTNFNFFVTDFSSYNDGQIEIKVVAKTVDNLEGAGFQFFEVDNNNDYLEIIIDNSDNNFSGYGGWTSSSQPDRYGNDYYVLPPGSTAYAKWNFFSSFTSTVQLYSMWSAHPNRATNAKYVVKSGQNDSTIIIVNQRKNGGVWNYLGDFILIENQPFQVIIYSSTEGYVIADAIRIFRNTSDVKKENFNLSFELNQNYPNPFNTSTTLSFYLLKDSYVKLEIYNLFGEKICDILNDYLQSGYHQLTYTPKEHASGIYFYRMTVNDDTRKTYSQIKKMVYLK